MKGYFRGLTGRLILGGLLVHLLLLPVTIIAILYILESGIKDLFLDHTRLSARLLADIIQTKDPETETESINDILDSAILAGQVDYVELKVQGRSIVGTLSGNAFAPMTFFDDIRFGQHNDTVYYMSLSILMGQQQLPAVLRLGFDEHSAREAIELSNHRLIGLIIGYVVLTIILLVYLSKRMTRPINQLRKVSRTVASGNFEAPLQVDTKITEVRELVDDLEEMRGQLVNQTIAVRQTNRRMSEQQERLIESETMAAVGEMASVVAHNIRNPLASIRSGAELTIDSNASESLKELSQDIINDVDRMDRWIREFLLLSNPHEIDPEMIVSMTDIVKKSLQGFTRELEKSGIEPFLEIAVSSEEFWGNEQLMLHLFNSLIANAVEAMPNGGTLSIKACEHSEDYLEIEVSDTGRGIPEDQLNKVFKPFFSSKQQGTGLGLFMAKRIVESHGGSISASSQIGKGTSLSLRFPTRRANKLRILLVDDEARFANNIKSYLEQYDYLIQTAVNGSQAMELFDDLRPEMVLLDVNLPDCSGLELLSRMKGTDQQVKVIMMTGKGNIQSASNGDLKDIKTSVEQAGADGFLQKPVSMKYLRRVIERTVVLKADWPQEESLETYESGFR